MMKTFAGNRVELSWTLLTAWNQLNGPVCHWNAQWAPTEHLKTECTPRKNRIQPVFSCRPGARPPAQVVQLLCRPDDATQIEFSKKSKLFKEIWSSHGALIGSEIMEENETEVFSVEDNKVTTEEIFSNSSKARASQPGLGQLLTESSW